MYTINSISLISIILVNNVWNSLQVPPTDDAVPDNSIENKKTINDLRVYHDQLNQIKTDILESIYRQEKGIVTLNKLLNGPGKHFEKREEIINRANESVKASNNVASLLIPIIDSINPYIIEKIDEIVKCISDAKELGDEKLCDSYITDTFKTSLNNFKFVVKRVSYIEENDYYIKNILNELTLKLQNNSNPHSRQEIIDAYMKNFVTASDKIKMYLKLSEEKKNNMSVESEKITDLKTSCMRSLKAIKRLNRVETENLQTNITHEYMFMKHTEGDIYKYIEDVLRVLKDAESIISNMMDKFNGSDNVTVDDILNSLDSANEILDNVVYTFSEEGNLYRAITVFKVSVEKSRRLVETANSFVDNLLITRNSDVFKQHKKPFQYLTVKNVIDSIKLLEDSKRDIESKVTNVLSTAKLGNLTYIALKFINGKEYKPTKLHEKLVSIGKVLNKKCRQTLENISSLLVISSYSQTISYMSHCLEEHTNKENGKNDVIPTEKLKNTIDCREGFKLLWNLNDRKAKNKIDKAIEIAQENLKKQQLLFALSILSRDYNSIGKEMKDVMNEVGMKTPEIGDFITNLTEDDLDKYLIRL